MNPTVPPNLAVTAKPPDGKANARYSALESGDLATLNHGELTLIADRHQGAGPLLDVMWLGHFYSHNRRTTPWNLYPAVIKSDSSIRSIQLVSSVVWTFRISRIARHKVRADLARGVAEHAPAGA